MRLDTPLPWGPQINEGIVDAKVPPGRRHAPCHLDASAEAQMCILTLDTSAEKGLNKGRKFRRPEYAVFPPQARHEHPRAIEPPRGPNRLKQLHSQQK